MKGALAVVALLFCVSPAAASPVELALSFHVPAQAAGNLEVHNAQWLLLVFSPESAASLQLDADGGSLTNYTHLNYVIEEHPIVVATRSQRIGSSTQEIPLDFRAEVSFENQWASLFIEADGIQLGLPEMSASIDKAEQGDPAWVLLPDLPNQKIPFGTYQRASFGESWPQVVPQDSVVLAVEGTEEVFNWNLKAQGVHRLHWYNATVTCATTGYCPDGQAYQRTSVPGRSNDFADVRTYNDAFLSDGDLKGSGSGFVSAFGSSLLDLALNGSLRLPDAVASCQDCLGPNGQTFTASGDLELKGLKLSSAPERVETQMQGAFQAASFDETPIFSLAAGTAAVGAAAVLGTVVLVKALLALFTRIERPALEHPRIRQVYDVVVNQPGLSLTELNQAANMGYGNVRRYLRRLMNEHLVVAREYRNTVRYFENHGRYDDDWQGKAALQDDTRRQLYDWIVARPGSTQTQILEVAQAWGLPRTTIQRNLKELVEAGVLRAERDHRFVHYWALQPQQARLPAQLPITAA